MIFFPRVVIPWFFLTLIINYRNGYRNDNCDIFIFIATSDSNAMVIWAQKHIFLLLDRYYDIITYWSMLSYFRILSDVIISEATLSMEATTIGENGVVTWGLACVSKITPPCNFLEVSTTLLTPACAHTASICKDQRVCGWKWKPHTPVDWVPLTTVLENIACLNG